MGMISFQESLRRNRTVVFLLPFLDQDPRITHSISYPSVFPWHEPLLGCIKIAKQKPIDISLTNRNHSTYILCLLYEMYNINIYIPLDLPNPHFIVLLHPLKYTTSPHMAQQFIVKSPVFMFTSKIPTFTKIFSTLSPSFKCGTSDRQGFSHNTLMRGLQWLGASWEHHPTF